MKRLLLSSWMAQRYLRSHRAGRFSGLLVATAVASIAVGIMALIVILSVMRGFRRELADRLLGFDAHITLTRQEGAAPLDRPDVLRLLAGAEVRDVAPFVQGEVIAQSVIGGELTAQGARVRGIDPGELGAMRKVFLYVPDSGDAATALAPAPGEPPGAIIGSEIVSQLTVHPDFGDRLTLTAPLAELAPNGELVPNRRPFRVAGVFRAGIFDYDSKLILVPLEDARRLLGLQATEGWQIRLRDPAAVPAVLARLAKVLPEGWEAGGIDRHNRKLFAALALERLAMGGILLMVLVIASCAIAGAVMLLAASRRKDAAILLSMGSTVGGVRLVFALAAAGMGAMGSLLGWAVGIAGCWALARWPLRLPASYYLDILPVELDPVWAALVAAGGVIVAVFAALPPVLDAGRLNPVEVLRYE